MNVLFDLLAAPQFTKTLLCTDRRRKKKNPAKQSFSKSILESDRSKSYRLKGYAAVPVKSNGSCGWQPSHVQMILIRGEVGVGS